MMLSPAFLSFATGFLSLSLEILWVRLFSFTNHSKPQAFAFVLIFYLAGIAFGALAGKKWCHDRSEAWRISGIFLLVSSLNITVGPWIYAFLSHSALQLNSAAILIFFSAFLNAVIFPIAHYLGSLSKTKKIGINISKIYAANIFGSTLGPILTGFFLLEFYTLQQSFMLISFLTLLLAVFCFYQLISLIKRSMISVSMGLLFVLGLYIQPNLLVRTLAKRIEPIKTIIENQHGIIVIYAGGKKGDIVLGNNVYDGMTNLDPVLNFNKINRVILLSAIQRTPKKVLIIGLSIGTWLKLVTTFPSVQSIDVIEINPGYLQAIENYPQQLSAVHDPRVQIYIDDGRNWLKRHPDKKYDLIIMNTTYHWRAYTSNLLSIEFFNLLKQHLNKGGVFAFNTTASPDAFKTATIKFKHAYVFENFVVAADFDWRKKLTEHASYKLLANLKLNNNGLFPEDKISLIHEYLHPPIKTIQEIETELQPIRKPEIISDQNLLTEYKYGQGL